MNTHSVHSVFPLDFIEKSAMNYKLFY